MKISHALPSRFEAVPAFIAGIAERLLKEFSVSPEEIFDIRLALEEAITNAIKHGNRLDPELDVEVSITCDGEDLVMAVRNQGKGFDVKDVPDPTMPQTRMRSSGRGIFLIKKVMDEVTFHDGGREIKMVKKLRR